MLQVVIVVIGSEGPPANNGARAGHRPSPVRDLAGQWLGHHVMYFHHDQTAELQHRVPGQSTRTVVGKQIMWKVRAEMVRLGITEDGWTPA